MLANNGKNREAEATIQHAVEIGRGYAHFHRTSAQTYQELIDNYPRQRAGYGALSRIYGSQGQYEKAVDLSDRAPRSADGMLYLYENVVNFNLALQRFDEARQIIRDAQALKLDDAGASTLRYALAWLSSDSAGMAEQQKWFADKPGQECFGLALAAATEAYRGHVAEARKLITRAVDSAARADNKGTGATWLAVPAQREAAFGYAAKARQSAAEALNLSPSSQTVASETALAFAMAGEMARAESLAHDLANRSPLDTQMHSLWLPAIRAQLAL